MADDMLYAEGLACNVGTGLYSQYVLTGMGCNTAARLRLMSCHCGSTKHDDPGYAHVECTQCGDPSPGSYLCVTCFYKNVDSGNYERNRPQNHMWGIMA